MKVENINFALDKEIKSKEQELQEIRDEANDFEDKQNKYKQTIKQQDALIKELRYQNEEIAKSTQNEIYVS